ncbi:MAG TPA: LPS export ABC transporter permease LptG [Gammaproteobacteria bacterium]|nr:LPS export ABC transporter permease LptG [Gammaproteobacteria bacterium]HIK71228.1 LPS export ABC transporter permease LptG [Pseudomonadales bacterium]
MIGRIDRYIAETVLIAIMLAALGLVSLLALFTAIEQIDDLKNSYTVLAVFRFVLLSLPRLFYETLPFAVLIGGLAGLGSLAGTSQLVVMRAAGISIWRIVRSVVQVAVMIAVFGLVVGEYLLPEAERLARLGRESALADGRDITPQNGIWLREEFSYMHIEQLQGRSIIGLKWFYFDENRQLTRAKAASSAVFHEVLEGDDYWILEDVTETTFSDLQGRSLVMPSQQWMTSLTPTRLSNEILVQPERMSMAALLEKIAFLDEQSLDARVFKLGFWEKALQPVVIVSLLLIAISFVFGPLRQSSMSFRIFTGLLFGVTLKFVQDLLVPASLVYDFHPFLAIILPVIICTGIASIQLHRV